MNSKVSGIIEDSAKSSKNKIQLLLLAIAVLLTVAVFAWFISHIYRSNQARNEFDNQAVFITVLAFVISLAAWLAAIWSFQKSRRTRLLELAEREKTAAAINESEQYQNLFKHANDAILIFEPENEIILNVNNKACEMYGLSREDFIGRSLKNLSQNVSRGTEELAKLLHDGVYEEFESIHLRADGTPLDLVINAVVIEYEKRPAILTINRDVSVRKQMEIALREREQHLISVTNSAQDAIVSADNDGNIIFWSEGARKIFGYAANEVVGKPLTLLMPEKYRQAHTAGMRRYAETGEERAIGQAFELDGLRKDGSEFPLELSLGVWETENGKYFSGIMRDITERRESRKIQAFREREAALRAEIGSAIAGNDESLQTNLTYCAESIVKNLDAAFARIWTLDEAGEFLELQAGAGIYTHLDDSHARVPVGKFEIGLIAQQGEPHITNDVLDDSRVGDKEWARQNDLVAFAGYPLKVAGNLVGVVAMFARHRLGEETINALANVADVIAQSIERRRAVESLKESERRYRCLGEGIMHQVWTALPDGSLDYVNRKTLDYFGVSEDRILKDGWKEVIHPDDLPECVEKWTKSLATGADYEVEFRLKSADGKYHWHLGRATAGYDDEGKIIKWFGTNSDIHTQRSVESNWEKSEEKFRSFIETTKDWIWEIDLEGNCVYNNPAVETILGYAPEELEGKELLSLIDREDYLKIKILLQQFIAEKRGWTNLVWSCVRKEGGFRYLESSAVPIFDGGEVIGFRGTNHDITERKKAEENLKESENKLRTLLSSMSEGLLQVDTEDSIVFVNSCFCEIVGYTEDELLDKNWSDLLLDNEGVEFVKEVNERRRKGIADRYELRLRRKSGETIYVMVGGVPILDANGKVSGSMGVFTDITGRKHIEEQLQHDAFHDGLTGLANRALFMDHLRMTIERGKNRHRNAYAVLFLDFDRFKIINDSLGHAEGDKLLKGIAQRLQSSVRTGDLVARLGGDEFVILLSEMLNINEAMLIAERIQNDLRAAFDVSGREIFITASIGITLSTAGHICAEDMLRDADIAMYRAKANGKAQFQVFDKEMHEHASQQLQIETEMRHALERREFQLHFQPIMSLETESLIGFEALVRWKHEKRGMIPPLEFIPAAEENGLILSLGKWILQESCRQLRQWQNIYPAASGLTVSVNLSCKEFSQFDLAEQIAETIKTTELDPRCLRLEITESHVMENSETAITTLNRLRDLGVQLSLDDFGTGYSSLSYLHRLPVNFIKIDRSFVMRMSESKENEEIVRTIIRLAQNLKMKVIAEGIESAEQLEQLKHMECEYGQGYFFSRPLEAEKAESFIGRTEKNIMLATDPSVINLNMNM